MCIKNIFDGNHNLYVDDTGNYRQHISRTCFRALFRCFYMASFLP